MTRSQRWKWVHRGWYVFSWVIVIIVLLLYSLLERHRPWLGDLVAGIAISQCVFAVMRTIGPPPEERVLQILAEQEKRR